MQNSQSSRDKEKIRLTKFEGKQIVTYEEIAKISNDRAFQMDRKCVRNKGCA